MKNLVLFSVAVLTTLSACNPDEELIEPTNNPVLEPTNNPALDAPFVGEWHHQYYDTSLELYAFIPTNTSYFFLPDGSGYLAGHSEINDVRPFQYQSFVNSLFLEFSDNNDEAYDYRFNSDSSVIYLWPIEEGEDEDILNSESYAGRLLRQ